MKTQCTLLATALLLLGPAHTGCARALQPTEAGNRYRSFTGTAYASDGDAFSWIVDVRASRIAEAQEFLPLQVALLNRSERRLEVFRESFVLETSDGTRLPMVAYREFEDDYARHAVDLRAGREFLHALNGRYPDPPFRHRNLEFYPHRTSGDVPRDMLELGQGELVAGFLYFRLPHEEALDEQGNCRLLFTPGGTGTQYVLELQVYRAKKKT